MTISTKKLWLISLVAVAAALIAAYSPRPAGAAITPPSCVNNGGHQAPGQQPVCEGAGQTQNPATNPAGHAPPGQQPGMQWAKEQLDRTDWFFAFGCYQSWNCRLDVQKLTVDVESIFGPSKITFPERPDARTAALSARDQTVEVDAPLPNRIDVRAGIARFLEPVTPAHINLWHTYHSHLIACYGDQGYYEEWGPFGRTGRGVWAGC